MSSTRISSRMRTPPCLLLLHLMLSLATSVFSQCIPSYPCTDCSATSVSRNARDCQVYYLCNYGRLVSTRSCSYNQVYSISASACITAPGAPSPGRCADIPSLPNQQQQQQQPPFTIAIREPAQSQPRYVIVRNGRPQSRRLRPVYRVRSPSNRISPPQVYPSSRPGLQRRRIPVYRFRPFPSDKKTTTTQFPASDNPITKTQYPFPRPSLPRRRQPIYRVRTINRTTVQLPAEGTQRQLVISEPIDPSANKTRPNSPVSDTQDQIPPISSNPSSQNKATSSQSPAPDPTRIKEQDKCGIKVSTYVIGGQRADRAEWAWQVSLQAYDSANNRFVHLCGGTLIDKLWVVTAAHCVYHSMAKISNFIVVAGQYRLRSQDPWRQMRGVDKAIPHRGFRPFGNFANDIALLRLSKPFNFTTAVRPACLPSTSDFPEYSTPTVTNQYEYNRGIPSRDRFTPKSNCWTTGWGKGQGREVMDREVLREVNVRFIDPSKCRQIWPGFVKHFHICGVANGGKACKGDSGGPMVCAKEGRYFLQGVVSWGEGTCNLYSRMPTVYTRVADYRDWIQYNLKRYTPPSTPRPYG